MKEQKNYKEISENLEKQLNKYKNIIKYLSELENLCGSKIIEKILKENSEDLDGLSQELAQYLQTLFLNLADVQDAPVFTYVKIGNTIISAKEIQRIEFFEEYNLRQQKTIYFIKIFKKYPSPEEEFYFLKFYSEEERNRALDILKAKMKQLGLNIL